MENALKFAAAFHGSGHGDFVGVLDVGAGGDSGGDAGDVERGGEAADFDGKIGGGGRYGGTSLEPMAASRARNSNCSNRRRRNRRGARRRTARLFLSSGLLREWVTKNCFHE